MPFFFLLSPRYHINNVFIQDSDLFQKAKLTNHPKECRFFLISTYHSHLYGEVERDRKEYRNCGLNVGYKETPGNKATMGKISPVVVISM